jgi:hypothetical protein
MTCFGVLCVSIASFLCPCYLLSVIYSFSTPLESFLSKSYQNETVSTADRTQGQQVYHAFYMFCSALPSKITFIRCTYSMSSVHVCDNVANTAAHNIIWAMATALPSHCINHAVTSWAKISPMMCICQANWRRRYCNMFAGSYFTMEVYYTQSSIYSR